LPEEYSSKASVGPAVGQVIFWVKALTTFALVSVSSVVPLNTSSLSGTVEPALAVLTVFQRTRHVHRLVVAFDGPRLDLVGDLRFALVAGRVGGRGGMRVGTHSGGVTADDAGHYANRVLGRAGRLGRNVAEEEGVAVVDAADDGDVVRAVASRTVTSKEPVSSLPAASAAEQVTVVVPMGRSRPRRSRREDRLPSCSPPRGWWGPFRRWPRLGRPPRHRRGRWPPG
jgi:hypothetical protein